MNIKKATFLFLALLLPACIFMFLKFFGKNEFDVPPLYAENFSDNASDCGLTITLPYLIPDSIKSTLHLPKDSLTLIYFGELNDDAQKQWNRLNNEMANEINVDFLPATTGNLRRRKCVFFLKDPYDMVLVDGKGIIRGQYISDDREEIDRLMTELTILLKKY